MNTKIKLIIRVIFSSLMNIVTIMSTMPKKNLLPVKLIS